MQYLASPSFGSPAAYSYCGPVFRFRKDGPGEFIQAGVESLGRTDREAADAEILALSLDAARLATGTSLTTKIGDAGLEHLYVLSNLKELNARGTQVTKAGLDRLKERLPDIRVGFGPAVK